MLSIQRHRSLFARPSLSESALPKQHRHNVPRLDSVSRVACVLRARAHVAHYGIVYLLGAMSIARWLHGGGAR